MPESNDKMYHSLGVRDAYANLATEIRARGLIDGVQEILKALEKMEPENPHVKPARVITDAIAAALKGGS